MNALTNSDERFNTEQRLTTLGEAFWEQLIRALRDYTKSHNAKAGKNILGVAPHNEYRVEVYAEFSSDHRKSVPVSYAPNRRCIEWGHSNDIANGHAYLLELVGDTHMVGVVSAGHPAKYTPEDIAKGIIKFVADYR